MLSTFRRMVFSRGDHSDTDGNIDELDYSRASAGSSTDESTGYALYNELSDSADDGNYRNTPTDDLFADAYDGGRLYNNIYDHADAEADAAMAQANAEAEAEADADEYLGYNRDRGYEDVFERDIYDTYGRELSSPVPKEKSPFSAVTMEELYVAVVQNHAHFSRLFVKLLLKLHLNSSLRDWIVDYYVINDNPENTGDAAVIITNENESEYKIFYFAQFKNANGNLEDNFTEAHWNPGLLAKWLASYTTSEDVQGNYAYSKKFIAKMAKLYDTLVGLCADYIEHNSTPLPTNSRVTSIHIDDDLNFRVQVAIGNETLVCSQEGTFFISHDNIA